MPAIKKDFVENSAYMGKLSMINETMQNLYLVAAPLANGFIKDGKQITRGMAEFVSAPVDPNSKFYGSEVQQNASTETILNFLRNPRNIVIQEFQNPQDRKGRPTIVQTSFSESLNSAISLIESWFNNDAKGARALLVDYWTFRYGKDSPKVEANSKWYDDKEKRMSEGLAKLKELKQLWEDPSPLGTPEKSKEFLGRMLGLGIDAGDIQAQVSALSYAVLYTNGKKLAPARKAEYLKSMERKD